MMIVFYVVLMLVTLVMFLAFIAPKNYHVTRSIVVDKSKDEVYVFLKYLKNHDKWSPWDQKDTAIKRNFKGTDGEIGCINSWEGNKEVGAGAQELVNLVPNTFIQTKIRFLKPWKSEADVYLNLLDVVEGTKVTWGISGKNRFPFSVFMLFVSMDKLIGKEFEAGLRNLKNIMESPEN